MGILPILPPLRCPLKGMWLRWSNKKGWELLVQPERRPASNWKPLQLPEIWRYMPEAPKLLARDWTNQGLSVSFSLAAEISHGTWLLWVLISPSLKSEGRPNQWFSPCGLGTSSVSVPWEHVRNADSWATFLTSLIKNSRWGQQSVTPACQVIRMLPNVGEPLD